MTSRGRNDSARPAGPSYVIRPLKYQSQRTALCTGSGVADPAACPRSDAARPPLFGVIKDAAAISGAGRADELERTRGMRAEFL